MECSEHRELHMAASTTPTTLPTAAPLPPLIVGPYGESWCKWTPPPYSPTSPLQLGPHSRSGDDREHPTNVSAAACRPTGHWATRADFQCGLGRPDHLWPLKWSRPQVSPDRGCGPKNWPNTVPQLILFPDSFLN
jgi:hypothetical protein